MTVDLLVIGGGPCGLAAAISAQQAGLSAVVIEAESVVSTIAHYPTYVRFFSTAEKLSLGGLPFIIATEKPTRRDALAYYRAVVKHFGVRLRQYERVNSIEKRADGFLIRSTLRSGERKETKAKAVVVAT
ncbi:MAG TPA: NAD(P)-binding domain-containing protein, partial [Gemmatimonadaceae bacterium]|nr:NAD(P)-binding domain-containing protein [Gemmatimonadaceae bacterium]